MVGAATSLIYVTFNNKMTLVGAMCCGSVVVKVDTERELHTLQKKE